MNKYFFSNDRFKSRSPEMRIETILVYMILAVVSATDVRISERKA